MASVGAIVRFLMLAACLVPFTSARQAMGTLAPHVPLTPGGPTNETPAPVSEDDERATDAKERLAAQSKHRVAARIQVASLPRAHAAHPSRLSSVCTTPPVAADPFRNGLGTPYRC